VKAVIQRVSRASVSVDGQIIGSCGKGFLILLGAVKDDTEENADLLAAMGQRPVFHLEFLSV
jgi:D-tyrosyl-tRNA(Tyr) deacylase